MSPYPQKRFEQVVSVYSDGGVVLRRYDTGASETIGWLYNYDPDFDLEDDPVKEPSYLMRSPKGHYFVYNEDSNGGSIEPVELSEAVDHYLRLEQAHMEFKEAFPDVPVEDA